MDRPFRWIPAFLAGLLVFSVIFAGCASDTSSTAVYQPAVAKLIESAQSLKNASQPDEAICRLTAAADLAPDSYPVHYNLGVLASENQRWDLAITHLQRAVEINPSEPNAYYTLAYTYESLGESYLTRSNVTESPELSAFSPMVRDASPEEARAKGVEAYKNAIKAYSDFVDVAPAEDPGVEDAKGQIEALRTKVQSLKSQPG